MTERRSLLINGPCYLQLDVALITPSGGIVATVRTPIAAGAMLRYKLK